MKLKRPTRTLDQRRKTRRHWRYTTIRHYTRPLTAFLVCVTSSCLLLINATYAQQNSSNKDAAYNHQFAAPPQRIISLLPSLTDIVCALGYCSRLVGLDRYSDWPLNEQHITRVGGGLDPSIEAIVMLKPDLVLASTATRIHTTLRRWHIPVYAFKTATFDDIRAAFMQIGALFDDTQRAQKHWQDILQKLNQLKQHLGKKKIQAYIELNAMHYSASEASYLGEILHALGIANIIPANWGKFPKINPEYVVKKNPDLIILPYQPTKPLATRPGWQLITAVKKQAVCTFTPEQRNHLLRPGPRIIKAAQLITNCLMQHDRPTD